MSEFELRLAQARLSEDAGEADKDNEDDSCVIPILSDMLDYSTGSRQLQGLKLAIKDPKVSIFAVMTISQLLGLSFVQFFPT